LTTCLGAVSVAELQLVPQIKITGNVGELFRIEYSDALGGGNDWAPLKIMVLPSSPYLYLDTDGTGKAKRFYRVTSDSRPPALVRINAGAFAMGSPVTEDDRGVDEGPQTSVTLSKGFWMGKTEVSQADYMFIMGNNPSAFADDMSRPVDSVSWDDAVSYCAKLTAQERNAGRLPAGHAYRLPTEAEWEYAARAGTTTRFCFGDDPGYIQLAKYSWYGADSDEISHPVESKLPNAWGLYDMHGNAWEWCSDWYLEGYSGGSVTDPQGPIIGIGHVIRGGSWKGLNRFCRSAARGSSFIPGATVGFRVVLAPVP
ncbi:MAG TPA: formylglycine-generating enzyme family protein, partial [Verrucomicrobiae bacterium]|nr:formylglycine-generating enzyme family protein [Verrucomicrobiae bacterium]